MIMLKNVSVTKILVMTISESGAVNHMMCEERSVSMSKGLANNFSVLQKKDDKRAQQSGHEH